VSGRAAPGRGAKPGLEDQATQVALGKPAQVPGDADSPNADAFDRSPEAEALRPTDVQGAPIALDGPGGSDPLDTRDDLPREDEAT
jgi:hypothetical protein